jgi:hypothetical protein
MSNSSTFALTEPRGSAVLLRIGEYSDATLTPWSLFRLWGEGAEGGERGILNRSK